MPNPTPAERGAVTKSTNGAGTILCENQPTIRTPLAWRGPIPLPGVAPTPQDPCPRCLVLEDSTTSCVLRHQALWDIAPELRDIICAAVNSYAQHFTDPLPAAQSDLLGEALGLLRELREKLWKSLVARLERDGWSHENARVQAADDCDIKAIDALLSQAKEASDGN